MQPKVSIVGAGPAGFALAADLQRHGTDVLVYSHPEHLRHSGHVIKNGCLTTSGIIEGSVSLRLSCDMTDVVHFSKTIILTVPSTGQETVLKELKGLSLKHHTLIAVPGNLFSLIAEAELEIGHILETNLSPYSCRMDEGNLIVLGRKSRFFIASLEKDMGPDLRDLIDGIFPMELQWCSSVVEVSLTNVNGVFHPLMMLMNAGRIENTDGDFLLYHDGLTRSVANAMEAVDNVRMQIGEVFGLRMESAIEVSNNCYRHTFTDLVDLAQNSKPHKNLKAPDTIHNRNISEDVPDLLVSWHDLAERLGIDASPIKAVIILAQMATGVDYMKKGRNLHRLNLDNMSKNELIERFHVASDGPEHCL